MFVWLPAACSFSVTEPAHLAIPAVFRGCVDSILCEIAASRSLEAVMAETSRTVFHYTFGHKLPGILASNGLIPTGNTLPPHERPALWYSSRADFEPTALKPIVWPGRSVPERVSFQELHALVGAYRFCGDATSLRLKPWPLCVRHLGIMPSDAKVMESAGQDLGAVPADWWATTHRQALSEHRFEAWDGMRWIGADIEAEILRWKSIPQQFASAATGARWKDVRAV